MKIKIFFFSAFLAFSLTNAMAVTASFGQGIAYYKAGFPSVAKPLLIAEVQSSSANITETCFVLGNIYFTDNQSDSAKYYFDKGVEVDMSNSLNAIGLTMLKIKSNPTLAAEEFETLLKQKQNKKNVDLYIAVSNAYLINGDFAAAQTYADRARSIRSRYAPVFVLMGDIELAKKNIGESCKFYEQAIYFDKESKEGYIKYARAYKQVNPDLAIQKLQELKAVQPGFLLVDREMADIYYSKNDFTKAAELYDNYLKSGNSNIQDLTRYALTLFLSGQFQKSLEVVAIGQAKEPRNAVFNRLSMFNNVDLKRNKEALEAADRLFNQSDKPEFSFLDYRYYGQAYRNMDSIQLAVNLFEKALTIDSTRTELWKDISDMYSKIYNYSSALLAYKKYEAPLSSEKKDADFYMTYGRLYYGKGTTDKGLSIDDKKLTLLDADSIFTIVASIEPDNYRGNFWRARTNSAIDADLKLGLAKPFYESTATLIEAKNDPRYNSILTECYKYLAVYSFWVKADYPESIKNYEKILKLDPANADAKSALDHVLKESAKTKKK